MKSLTPLDSATVILIRDVRDNQYEICLMRRSQNLNIVGGAYVFPGGCMDEEDCAPELVSHSSGVSASIEKLKKHEPELPEENVRGLFFAAIREVFEEAGILLAYNGSGNTVSFSEDASGHIDRFAGYRFEIHEKKITLIDIAKMENISYALKLLIPYAHWITPEGSIAKKRFNARFFIAKIPPGQIPVHDSIEMTDSLWVSPGKALELSETGDLLLMPPTYKNIEELNEFHTTEELISSIRTRKINTTLPQLFKAGDEFGLRLPHDPEYSIAAYKQPHRPGETSRFINQQGKWKAVR